MSTWCNTADCAIETIGNNILQKFFQITGAINNIAETYLADTPALTDHAAYFKKFEQAGMSIGKIIRVIYNYK